MDGWVDDKEETRRDTTHQGRDRINRTVSFLPEGICLLPSFSPLEPSFPSVPTRPDQASEPSKLFVCRPRGPVTPNPNPRGLPCAVHHRKRWDQAPVAQAGHVRPFVRPVPNPNQPRSQMVSQTPIHPGQPPVPPVPSWDYIPQNKPQCQMPTKMRHHSQQAVPNQPSSSARMKNVKRNKRWGIYNLNTPKRFQVGLYGEYNNQYASHLQWPASLIPR
jgi:hypothetical protein